MIVAFGDSITYGQHLADRALAWPNLIVSQQAIYSAAVPGDTTRKALERFPTEVQSISPATVVIQFGHNDCNRWETDRGLPRVSLAAFKANLIEMVERCRTFGSAPFLCSLTPTFRGPDHVRDVVIYDQMIRRVADDEGVPLIDVRAAFLGIDGMTTDYLLDDLHLNEKGHCLYAKTVQAVLDREAIG